MTQQRFLEDTVTKLFFSSEDWTLSYKMFTLIQTFDCQCPWFLQVVHRLFFLHNYHQHAKKVESDSPMLLDFTIGQVNSVIYATGT